MRTPASLGMLVLVRSVLSVRRGLGVRGLVRHGGGCGSRICIGDARGHDCGGNAMDIAQNRTDMDDIDEPTRTFTRITMHTHATLTAHAFHDSRPTSTSTPTTHTPGKQSVAQAIQRQRHAQAARPLPPTPQPPASLSLRQFLSVCLCLPFTLFERTRGFFPCGSRKCCLTNYLFRTR